MSSSEGNGEWQMSISEENFDSGLKIWDLILWIQEKDSRKGFKKRIQEKDSRKRIKKRIQEKRLRI